MNKEITKLLEACNIINAKILIVTMIENRAIIQFATNDICYLTYNYDKNIWEKEDE